MHYFDIIIPSALAYFWLLSNLPYKLAQITNTMDYIKYYICSHCVPFWISLITYWHINTEIHLIPFLLINVLLTKILERYAGTGF